MRKFLLLLTIFLCVQTTLHAEDNYCYLNPDKCPEGAVIVLSISDDVAKYCDFDKQIIVLERRTRSKSSFNNQDVVCVKIAVPRKKLK